MRSASMREVEGANVEQVGLRDGLRELGEGFEGWEGDELERRSHGVSDQTEVEARILTEKTAGRARASMDLHVLEKAWRPYL